ncbi:TPA: pyocin knob domain-containing protein [Pseudomonas aeruginosa]|uniref:pyocin knob domain-containing protein n=1 Tax=Pseudomonas aeruginosa TaxID=287 RepID=UPI000E312124|nr:pyocin knob domain-containing protein [Pseudomonas aeruginosa]MDV6567660.1 phage tail protein [Pseudomonas aeruginosa]MDX4005161.1 pyocin knob domain-containing protein [Pseudomonas aeruginosa]MEB5091208.1 pyocin knob domain-containing protein [Pseudomonas aeruginosa]MEB5097424.1 pyocin knob domain-containing protein [Pseudomonas aeruginosa]MEB5109367.1 pyocin knob domain-containing protein [Pseudomonas aeruginosa]
MAWYSAGTVAVTANSPTVTGTGTQFSSNARVGDAFRGPDGRWYEVTNVASSTVISIKPNYQGSTASGQAYAVAPILGYDKDLSDRFNQIAMDWGATLAGIKPWALSNTGTQAQADMGMTAVGRGLNAAATAENALSFIGGMPKSMSNLRAVSDANNVPNECGFYGISVGPWANLPPGIDSLNPVGSMLYHQPYDASTAVQMFIARTSDLAYFRRKAAGTWSTWMRFLTDRQLSGTVSNDGSGVPNGAIIQRGSNVNGEYARFADGTQICWRRYAAALDVINQSGSLFITPGGTTLTFPAAFVSAPVVSDATIRNTGYSGRGWGAVYSVDATSCAWYGFSTTSALAALLPGFIATGRWF